MAKVFVSSTYFDLREFRQEVRGVLRRLGHEDVAMEYYVAEDHRPAERALADVAKSDLFIGILAWRYGWIPPENNPGQLSLTELEYRQAIRSGKPYLMFLLHEDAAWPRKLIDSNSKRIEAFRREVIKAFRREVVESHSVAFFTSLDELISLITQALYNWRSGHEANALTRDLEKIAAGTKRLRLPSPPDDLISALAKGECVLYSGAGLSAELKFPTWSLFISGLLQWARDEKYVEGGFANSLKEAVEYGDTDLVADSLISAIGSDLDALNKYLRKVFLSSSPELPKRHVLLSEIPFCAVLSTNFDNLLERTFEKEAGNRIYTPKDTEQLLAALSKNDFYILKLYGALERPDSVIVAPAQYQAAVAENLIFSQFMDSLFFSRTMLFLGASLDGIAAYLKGLKFRGTSAPRQHYALVDVTGSAWKVKAELLQRRYGIQVLPYTASPGYPEVGRFLEQIIAKLQSWKVDAAAAVSGGTKSQRPAAWLNRLHLENIGPFENQGFELNRTWNVLFGDNGVGKSSVLKAIAVGICGQDAKPYAEQLIKAEQPSATITLEIASEVDGKVEKRNYITKLHRTRTGAEVETIPTRPLEAENLLSLGFPALRAVGESKSADSREGEKEGPDPGDLLPLITGAPDMRLDKLKNWILDLDHLIKDAPGEDVRAHLEGQFRELFDVIRKLTSGVDLELDKIDVRRKRIMVRTQGAVIPIDYVSQGTSSLIGWIGILLRRLFAMYGKLESPRAQYALVLIDEIDAHMHPQWQQSLPVDVRGLFPAVQVIATTHSPLIVPSLQRGEIFSFTRDPGSQRIVIEKIMEDFQGYRADQVLTSRLFRLLTSRDRQSYDELMEYTDLAVKDALDEQGQKRLEELSEKLKLRLPLPWEQEEARRTYELIRNTLTKEIEKMDFDRRGRILDEVKAQLLEIDPNTWRLS